MYLVTGGTGFIGSELVKQLGNYAKLRCLVRSTGKAGFLKKSGAEIALGSLEDRESLEKAAKGCSIVFHLAASLGTNKEELERVNVQGTKNLADACRRDKVKKIVYVSSYLADKGFRSEYGKSKRAGEEIVKKSGIPFVVLRPGVVYGPGEGMRNIARVVEMVRSMPVVPVVNALKMQPVFVKDVAKAVVAAARDDAAVGKTYGISGPEQLNFGQMVAAIEKAIGERKLKAPVPLWAAKLLLGFYSGGLTRQQLEDLSNAVEIDISKAKEDLGFRPMRFEKGIKLTCARSP